MRKIVNSSLLLVALSTLATSQAATEADVESSFHPYGRDSANTGELSGYTPEMVIDQGNYQQFVDALPEGLSQHLDQGWYRLKTMPVASVELAESYQQATRDHLNATTLGVEFGQINGYIAGRPFPEEPNLNDPRAAEKIAWNFQRGYAVGDSLRINPFFWNYRNLDSGKRERRVEFDAYMLAYMGRVDIEPLPNLAENRPGVYRGFYLRALKPYDVTNTQLLIHRYADDSKRDDSWMYLGFQRRVRRLGTGQTTDSFLGSDLMIEDFNGYNGRLSDYEWRFLGTADYFLPFYKHDQLDQYADDMDEQEDGYQFIGFGGQGNCFPQIKWQLRKTYRLEIKPKQADHPIGKRLLYLDAQTYTIAYQDTYDRGGLLWKSLIVGQAHPDYYESLGMGKGISFFDTFTAIDNQAHHCTTGQLRMEANSPAAEKQMFTVQHLRATGR